MQSNVHQQCLITCNNLNNSENGFRIKSIYIITDSGIGDTSEYE